MLKKLLEDKLLKTKNNLILFFNYFHIFFNFFSQIKTTSTLVKLSYWILFLYEIFLLLLFYITFYSYGENYL
jgi:hypothetical protein